MPTLYMPTGTATVSPSIVTTLLGTEYVMVYTGTLPVPWEGITIPNLAAALSGAAGGGGTPIKDANGNTLIGFPAAVTSAVNYVEIDNAAAEAAGGADPGLSAKGTDTNVSLSLTPKGSGVLELRGVVVDKRSHTALIDTATVTAAQLLTKILDGIPTAGATYTLPTAALLVAAIPGAKVGDSFQFLVSNQSLGANTITLAAGSGGTPFGVLTTLQNVVKRFTVTLDNVTGSSEAYTLYGN